MPVPAPKPAPPAGSALSSGASDAAVKFAAQRSMLVSAPRSRVTLGLAA